MKPPVPAFAGQPLDRADHLRRDPASLAMLAASGDALLLSLDGLSPVLDGAGRLVWHALDDGAKAGEMVFLGLLDGRAAFARVPEAGDTAPAYAHRSSWHPIATLPLDELAIYGGARSLEHEGSLLLGRQSRFPPRSFSALAGFVEPGETLEEAVAREVLEEVGLAVRDVRYIASQPWPFPSQLMLGCHAFADECELVIDLSEIEQAQWFTREEVAEAVARGEKSSSFLPPPARAIAHLMLEWWLGEGAMQA